MNNNGNELLYVLTGMRRLCLLAAIAFWLGGCSLFSSSPKQPLPNEIKFEVANDANVDAQGRSVPIQVKVFILNSSDRFEASDYFSLQDNAQTMLGGEMVGNEQHIFQPGEKYTMKLKGNPEARMVGVIAGYRDLNSNRWRLTAPLPEEKKTSWYKFWQSSPTKMEMRIAVNKGGIEVLPAKNP